MKVLVVEDDVKLARAIKRGLVNERLNVEIAHDTDTAAGFINGDSYDVIVLDWMLPGELDGVGFCSKLREDNNQTPVLMLTARGATRDKIKGLNTGADDYLVKPFAFDELVARIRALARRSPDSKSPVLKVGDIELDPVKKTVKRQDQQIYFSRREFMVVEHLMRNAGAVVSKQQLIDSVWEFDSDVLDNTVEVYIGYIRAKLEKPFNSKVIRTMRGFGYKIEE